MQRTELHTIIDQHKRLGDELICHLRTREVMIFEYLDHHLAEMTAAETKMIVAMLVECRADLSPSEMATVSGLHPNTVRKHILGKHLKAVNKLFTRWPTRGP